MTPDEQLNYFARNYEILVQYVVTDQNSGVVLGGAEKPTTCRYCGLSEPKVSFKKKAHALPEFIGNKWIISRDECDSCNEFFSQTIEDDLGKYLGALRTLSQIYGKKGVPTYKSKDDRSRIEMLQSGLQLTSYEDEPLFELDEEAKCVKVKAHRQPYTPMGVFKCLVKMAIAVAPLDALEEMRHLVTWILQPNHSVESFPYRPLIVLQQFTPGPKPYPGISIFLLRRKAAVAGVPYMQFVVAFANTLFQIVVPMPEQDKNWLGSPIHLVLFPVPFTDGYEYGPTTRRELDLSNPEIVREEVQELQMKFESMSEEPGGRP